MHAHLVQVHFWEISHFFKSVQLFHMADPPKTLLQLSFENFLDEKMM